MIAEKHSTVLASFDQSHHPSVVLTPRLYTRSAVGGAEHQQLSIMTRQTPLNVSSTYRGASVMNGIESIQNDKRRRSFKQQHHKPPATIPGSRKDARFPSLGEEERNHKSGSRAIEAPKISSPRSACPAQPNQRGEAKPRTPAITIANADRFAVCDDPLTPIPYATKAPANTKPAISAAYMPLGARAS